jgi:hypothetical protein
MSVKQLVQWESAGETEVLGENLPSATFSTINRTWPDLGLNPGRRRKKPATNRLSYGAAKMHRKSSIHKPFASIEYFDGDTSFLDTK